MCSCPRPVSRPPAAAGEEGQSSRPPCAPNEGIPPSLPGTFIPGLQLPLRFPGSGEKPGRVGDGPLGSPASCGTRNPLTPRFTVASTEQSVRRRPVRRLAAFVLRSDRTRHQGPPCVGTVTPPRLSREGKLEEIGAPGM